MNVLKLMPFLLIAVFIAACSDEPEPTPTLVPPTQTPFIITATPLPATATPLPTDIPTVTPVPETEAPAADDNDDSDSGGASNQANPVSNIKPNCTPRQSWQTYVVQVGDTLGRLASQTNSTLNTLANANCLVNPNIIVVGQTLRVPGQPDKGDEPEPIIEDLITMFDANQPSAVPGETITLSWTADADSSISIVNKTLNTTIIGSELGATGSLTYTIPNTVDPEDTTAMTFSISGKLVRDEEDVFANPVERTISIESPLDDDDDCDATGETDTTDDDCDDDTGDDDDCDATGETDTTDDDCDDDTGDDDDCDATGETDTTDDDCDDDTGDDDDCDATGETDTTDDDCDDDTGDDDTGNDDTSDDDTGDDDTGDDDTSDDDTDDDTGDDDTE